MYALPQVPSYYPTIYFSLFILIYEHSTVNNFIDDNHILRLPQIGGFLRVLRFPTPLYSHRHDITELLLIVALNTNNHNSNPLLRFLLKCVLLIPVYSYVLQEYIKGKCVIK